MPGDTAFVYVAGVVTSAWRFALSPSGIAYACLVAATVAAWFSTQPLIGLSVLVCLIQIITSPEFILRARLKIFFWQDVNAANVHIFGSPA